jgi:hypothetical protein
MDLIVRKRGGDALTVADWQSLLPAPVETLDEWRAQQEQAFFSEESMDNLIHTVALNQVYSDVYERENGEPPERTRIKIADLEEYGEALQEDELYRAALVEIPRRLALASAAAEGGNT